MNHHMTWFAPGIRPVYMAHHPCFHRVFTQCIWLTTRVSTVRTGYSPSVYGSPPLFPWFAPGIHPVYIAHHPCFHGSHRVFTQCIWLTTHVRVLQDYDIYLLDDPLAAVDAKVAKHIFDKCVMGELATKARILCTHHIDYLWDADQVLVMDAGTVIASGKSACARSDNLFRWP